VEDVEGAECVVCMSEARDTMVLPCRHMCLCSGCATAVMAQADASRKCPVCRAEMQSLLRLEIQSKSARRETAEPV
jgi:hypothetical protein